MGADELAPKSSFEVVVAAVYDMKTDLSWVTCEVQPESIIQWADDEATCCEDCNATS